MGEAWLSLTCCKGVTHVPVKLLRGAAHPAARLRDVLPRLRCSVCHDRPAEMALIESPAAISNDGPPRGWVISLS